MNLAGSVAHCDVLALPGNSEPRFFQSADCSLVVDSGDSRHWLDGCFDYLGLRVFDALDVHFNLVKAYFEIAVFRRIIR